MLRHSVYSSAATRPIAAKYSSFCVSNIPIGLLVRWRGSAKRLSVFTYAVLRRPDATCVASSKAEVKSWPNFWANLGVFLTPGRHCHSTLSSH